MRVLAAILLLLLPGCVVPTALRPADAACVEPHPCGAHWPEGLEGPFAIREIVATRVAVNGVELAGDILLPDVPEGTRVPVVLWAHPYFGQTYPDAASPDLRDGSYGLPVARLVEEGYAVAAFNVRGSGASTGCFEMFGPNEADDLALLVEWLAAQEWSNGRVGMAGLSYHGTTPWMAAVRQPPALKTIVVAGMVSDLYTFYHTPQGAAFTIGPAFQAAFDALVSLAPPAVGLARGGAAPDPTVVPGRACPEVARTVAALAQGGATDERDADYWTARRLIDGFPNVTAAVYLTHGLQDQWGSGHQQQEDAVWATLPNAPKRMLVGQWAHEFPDRNTFRPDYAVTDWEDRLVAWLDHWLKGTGEAPALGVVEYQDSTGAWRESAAWPPVEAREEALHLAGGTLSPVPGGAATTFRSVPDPLHAERGAAGAGGAPGPVCAPATHAALLATEPLAEDVVLAGNPFALLRVTSDQPGGLLTLTLLDLAPDFACVGGTPRGARALVQGAADLRFHAGGYAGRGFPVGTPTDVRIDVTNLAEVVPAGHRLAVLVSHGDPALRASQPYAPTLTLDPDASHVVLPVVEGTLGGAPPMTAYPPRPFVPPASP